ncbi:MAG: hypothetical protein EAZ53_00460 [Bacteroidetes bacterium]|nr:MAG: hypothetical protein EAZ53_00460 [Bacteroidota bacterium]
MKTDTKLSKKELAAAQEAALVQQTKDKKRIKSLTPDVWKKIENWGRESQHLSQYLQTYCFTIAGRVRKNTELEPLEITNAIKVLEIVEEKAPELIETQLAAAPVGKQYPKLEVNPDVIAQAVQWDKKNKKLKSLSFTYLLELSNGKKAYTEGNKKNAAWILEILQKCGFEYRLGETAE